MPSTEKPNDRRLCGHSYVAPISHVLWISHLDRNCHWLFFMRVLVACEFSGIVRDAFAANGHDAWSCDVLPSESSGQHYQGDVRDFLEAGWDLLIAHPPCTHLAASGARWFKEKADEQAHALGFVLQLWRAPVARIAIENPIGILSSAWRKPDQIIQPWQFGHGETKATCLWLKNLPHLRPTEIAEGREPRIHFMPPSAERSKERSRSYLGIAEAMADQWSIPTTTRTSREDLCTAAGTV